MQANLKMQANLPAKTKSAIISIIIYGIFIISKIGKNKVLLNNSYIK